MRWLRRSARPIASPADGPRPGAAAADEEAATDDEAGDDIGDDIGALLALSVVGFDAPAADDFACSTCGRTDLPPAGDWDPPICLECDAAINFDAIAEAELVEGW